MSFPSYTFLVKDSVTQQVLSGAQCSIAAGAVRYYGVTGADGTCVVNIGGTPTSWEVDRSGYMNKTGTSFGALIIQVMLSPITAVFTCPVCGQTFSTQADLTSHISNQHGIRPDDFEDWIVNKLPWIALGGAMLYEFFRKK